MHVNWVQNRCIACLSDSSPLSLEHIIPASVGGRLTSNFLCRDCNSNFGHRFDHGAINGPSIVIALNQLKDLFPGLTRTPLENYAVALHSEGGTVPGRLEGENLRVRGHTAKDGSLVLPTDIGRASLKTILQREGIASNLVEESLRAFDEAPGNQKIFLSPTVEAVKWDITEVSLDLSRTKLMSDLVPAKIAYEFLALHVGSAIYQEAPQFTEVRHALTSGTALPPLIRVERLMARDYKPVLRICFEAAHPHTRILIRFPGWLSFRVHFDKLRISGNRLIYNHNLATQQECVDLVDAGNAEIVIAET